MLAFALIFALILSRLPWWLSAVLLALAALFTGALLSADIERLSAPLLLFALAAGLLVPLGSYVRRSSRVAPARKRQEAGAGRVGNKASKNGGEGAAFEAVEIPGYEILEKVGSGGMASVYRARRLADGHTVALKVPMEQYVADAKFIRRFHREAEVAQRLDHPSIVRTFEHGSLGVKHYMVMEYVDGRSLESYIEADELDLGLSLEIMKPVVDALQHIHSAGIIHRDIKPANIMILRGGIHAAEPRVTASAIKLMDFGIAGGKVLSRLTMTGARVGTPVYMSPEQARGLRIDHRSDIYSLGLVFYEMLTGQTAFKGGYEAIVHQQIFQTPPPPRQLNLQIPKAIDALVMKMIAKDPEERPRLEQVLELLGQDEFKDTSETELPSRILLTAGARQGVLRVLDTSGNLHSSFGEIGANGGSFSAAPLSIALDSKRNIYAAIFEYRVGHDGHQMIHKLGPEGEPLFAFGGYGMQPGEFLYPVAVTVSPGDTVYVLDAESHLVQRFDSGGRYLGKFGGRGAGKGLFNEPKGVLAAADGSVYVLDYGNRQLQRFDASGAYQARWAFRLGSGEEGMRLLDGFTVDDFGNIYLSDATGSKIRKITPKGKIELSYPVEPLQGEATDTLLDLGIDDSGFLYAARRGGHLIRRYDLAGRLLATMETYAPVVQMLVDIQRRDTLMPVVDTQEDLLIE
jgi:serine/threonine-protein kinase